MFDSLADMSLSQRMDSQISSRLPKPGCPTPSSEQILDSWLSYISEIGTTLYPAQEEAILELYDSKNVILNTPTGSGKSLVAAALHFDSLSRGNRSYYTSPIKALVNEKFLALCRQFGPERVGMITGDASVNSQAPIICCTAEILAITALREGAEAAIQDVVMDEFHYYTDRERGWAWQVPLLTMQKTRFLLMSATLGDTSVFETCLTALNGRPTAVVRSDQRPVPLEFSYSLDSLPETSQRLVTQGRAPIYIVNFTQREAAEIAQDFLSLDFCTKDEKRAIQDAIGDFRFTSPYGKEIQKLLRHGVGIHHAGLLPKYRVLVEKLAQKGLLKVICGTDTLGVGVNVPIRSVLFTKLSKYDGHKTANLTVRDFKQIAGRAGRKGFDDLGTVVALAPEHVIENTKLDAKVAKDPSKAKKIVKKKPPDGFVGWTEETFKKLADGQPEGLVSRFKITHAVLLHVLSRKSNEKSVGCDAARELIRNCHESDHAKKQHRKKAFQLFRSLVERKIVEILPDGLRLNIALQEDFSLHHALSLFLLDAVSLFDVKSPDYALDILSLVESLIEDPDVILRKQVDALKTLRMAELKMQGMEFDERIAELEKIEHPKPNAELIYSAFNAFSAAHPWVGAENIRPKSIAREMYERFMGFSEYIRDYGLQRSEGLVLRYLSEVYKTLTQTVPSASKTDEILAIEEYFESMLRGIDSSLLDEWEKLRNPAWVAPLSEESPDQNPLVAERALRILLNNETFRLVRWLSRQDYEGAAEHLASHLAPQSSELWSADRLEDSMKDFWVDRSYLLTDSKARSGSLAKWQKSNTDEWWLEQVLTDSEGHNDYLLKIRFDLKATRAEVSPRYEVMALGPMQPSNLTGGTHAP